MKELSKSILDNANASDIWIISEFIYIAKSA